MSKSVKALVGAMVGAVAFVTAASSAQAHWHHGCYGCGPQPTRYVYKDVNTYATKVEHYKKWHHYPVYIPRETVYVTRIHPHVNIHKEITIYEKPYPVIVDHSKTETVTEATTYTYSTSTSVVHLPCGCWHPVCHK